MNKKKQFQKNKMLFDNRINVGLKFSFQNLFSSLILLLLLFLNTNNTNAQSMGISGVAIIPDPSSILEMRTTAKGMLIPRMTQAERDLINSPANGLMAYNTSTNQFNFFNGFLWIALKSNSNSDLTGEVTSVGNSATLGSFASTSLSTALTNETGTALAVFSDSPLFTGTPTAPTAILETNTTQLATTAFVLANTDAYTSVNAGATITTTSTTDVQITGVTVTPGAGTYCVSFSAQCDLPNAIHTVGVSTANLCTDLSLIYNDLINIPTTSAHPLIFGSGEILFPGVYAVAGAMSIADTLRLNGQGLTNPLFIMKCVGAFNTGAGTVIILTNGAKPENVFWLVQDAIGLGANTTLQGTMISNSGAVAAGANCKITGRMFTKLGAVAFGPGIISTPVNPSSLVNLRGLASFVLYTCGGGIGNTTISTFNGDIASNSGAITGFTAAGTIVNGTIYQQGSTNLVTPVNHVATFSLYQDGVLIPNSERTRTSITAPSDIYLQGVASVTAGQTIEARWKVDTQVSDNGAQVSVKNRILTLTKVR
jgi:hypothetical protein